MGSAHLADFTVTNPLTPWEWLTFLLGCAADSLDELVDHDPDFLGAPDRQFIDPGDEVAWDDCCDFPGGQLWTRLITAQPVNPLPNWDSDFTKCSGPMGIQLGVGILRCAHTIDEQGNAPAAALLTADARQGVADMIALREAIVCCDTSRKVLGQWTRFIGGGCVGGEWTVWLPARFAHPETSPGSP